MIAIVRTELFLGNKKEIIIRDNGSVEQIEQIEILRNSNDLTTTYSERE